MYEKLLDWPVLRLLEGGALGAKIDCVSRHIPDAGQLQLGCQCPVLRLQTAAYNFNFSFSGARATSHAGELSYHLNFLYMHGPA